jgi:hypothetical protein
VGNSPVEEQTTHPEDEGPIDDNVGIDADDNNVSDLPYLILLWRNLFMLMKNQFLLLNGFVTLCIEKKLLNEIDIEAIINDFAAANVRR